MRRSELVIKGKFFLYSRKDRKYFLSMGKHMDDGGESESYLYWTKYSEWACGFNTIKHARAMQRMLIEKGHQTIIVNRKREAVC